MTVALLKPAAEDDIVAFRAPPVARKAAQLIRSDEEALDVAANVAESIAQDAVLRDRERRLPHAELDLLSERGILAITVPKAHGGAGVKAGTLAEVIARLAAADGSIG